MKRRVVLLGPPGSGKGTIAQKLEEQFGLEHISTGQWFRREMDQGTELSSRVREALDRGELIPDDVVIGLLHHWLTPEMLRRGYLLDGFPRTHAQAEALDAFSEENDAPLELVLFLECADSEIVHRITGRRVCLTCGRVFHVDNYPPRRAGICDVCGSALVQRTDDTEEVIKDRLRFYKRITEPLVDYYRERDKLVSLNAGEGAGAAQALAVQAIES